MADSQFRSYRMFKEHYVFTTPPDDASVWRYMDFTKLVALLETRTLRFTLLGLLEDKYEGHYSLPTVEYIRRMPEEGPPEHRSVLAHNSDFMLRTPEVVREIVYVSCWHVNDFESSAMWKLYLKSGEGVAIRTSFLRLKESLADSREVNGGLIRYIDYTQDEIELGNFFHPVICKRRSFQHEAELRLAVVDPEVPVGSPGLDIEVDLERLIDKVYLAPGTERWIYDLMGSVLRRYEISASVVQSDLEGAPAW